MLYHVLEIIYEDVVFCDNPFAGRLVESEALPAPDMGESTVTHMGA